MLQVNPYLYKLGNRLSIDLLKPNFTRSEILRTSSCAILDMSVSRNSASGMSVLILSDWNSTPTPLFSSSWVY